MLLSRILTDLPGAEVFNDTSTEVSSVVYDSRRAGPGALFVAVPGLKSDGHDFLGSAIAAGAPAVVVQRDREGKWSSLLDGGSLPTIVVEDTRASLPPLAATLNDHPTRKLGVIGVTGTDGKTSLCSLVDHVLGAAGGRPGLITTAECGIGERSLLDTGRFTTPEAPELQAMLKEMVDAGCDWAVIEATSHGLAQHRLDRCDLDIAAVTTVGSDHLDFHGSLDQYVRAKGRLFQMLDEGAAKRIVKTAVLNGDDPVVETFRNLTRARVISYGLGTSADVVAEGIANASWGSSFKVVTQAGSIQMRVGKPGTFSVQNALAAVAVSMAAGLQLDEAVRAIESWEGAPGRMELIDEGQPFEVVVDFAHAPDSLERVLRVLRDRSRGRLIAVFGCIGERERDRRFAMGQVAARRADFTVVTDDNPYTEDRDGIIREIVAGLEAAGKRSGHDFAVIADRREAIAQALAMAVDEDTVLLAGKGHETEVHLPDSVYECDDRAVARTVLRDLGNPARR